MAKNDDRLPYGENFTREMLRKREETMGDPLRRREAVPLDSMLAYFLRDSGLMGQWNENRIFKAWNHCSKAEKYTLSKSYVAGTLYVSLSSSVVRNQLYFQLDIIKKAMNLALAADRQFWMKPVDGVFVKNIVLR